MLKKLLKYDFQAMFKYWWIAAISSIALAAVGGASLQILSTLPDDNIGIILLAFFGFLFSIIGLGAFSVLSNVVVFIRFYKNFFSDEGYLTFTLPVKRTQLLNSKLISSVAILLSTATVLVVDIFMIFAIGMQGSPELTQIVSAFAELPPLLADIKLFIAVIVTEGITLIVLFGILSTLSMFFCITFGALIARRAKVFVGIAIYYGINWLIMSIMQMFTIFVLPSISVYMANVQENLQQAVVLLLFLGMILILFVACALMYTLVYWLLDRKLNLS